MQNYILNPETLLYEVENAPKYRKYVLIAALSVAAVGLVCLYIWLFTAVFKFELPKTALIKKSHAEWETRVDLMNRQIRMYNEVLSGIEQRDDEVYRAIYGLNKIPDAVKNSGLGGVNRYASLERSGANEDLRDAVVGIDMLTKRTYIQSKGLDEVMQMSRQAGDMIACVPNVPPIFPGRGTYTLSGGFGYRRDPVYGGSEFHQGQDFATKRGNPVYVTGGGVVEKANFQFNGYGNEIVVNHGYGYETRYAHLNTIEVTEGMKLQRGDRIGTVGATGKSTGSHLHYEVIYRGNRVNPLNYMDLSMPESEYRAMIEKRSAESPRGKMSSTTELLRRNKPAR